MELDNSLVSIITPTYNSANYIAECVASVQAQTYKNFEMIIVDDASTDETVSIVADLAKKDSRLSLVQLTSNSGAAVSRNVGIERISGRYMTFIDADDIWMPVFIERSIETIKNESCPFVFASYKRMDENLTPLLSDFIVPDRVTYYDILKSNSISCLTAFVDIGELGKKYMPLIRKRQDMGLWLAYLKETDYAKGIKEPMAIYRIRKNSLSRNKWALLRSQWVFYRVSEKLSLVQTFYYMAHWIVRGFLKYRN